MSRNPSGNVKAKHVECICNGTRARIIANIWYMLGLGGVMKGFYELSKVYREGYRNMLEWEG